MLVHLLKLQGWPDSAAAAHWRTEIVAFQSDAEQRFTPSMGPSIDLVTLYRRTVQDLKHAKVDGITPRFWPVACPLGLDDLLNNEQDLLERLIGQDSQCC